VMVAIIFISVLPMVVEFFLAWRQRRILARTMPAVPRIEQSPIEESTRQAS
jgi:hypothetical protein